MAIARRSWHEHWRLIVGFYGDGEAAIGPALKDFFDTVPITGPRTELCDIMAAHRSDKGSGHNYSLLYHFLFRHRRSEVTDLFELGIGTNFVDVPSSMGRHGTPGASLRAWRDYFPHAQIVGADVDQRIMFSDDRIATYYVDQRSKEAIDALWENFPARSFDIMIDDGLHEFEANAIFLKNSLHKLRQNGFYIIEDIGINEQNLKKFHDFFTDYGASGALLHLPTFGYNTDNCVAIFRGRPR